MKTIKNLPLTHENFSESMSQMIDVLSKLKFTPAEINLTNLLVEETFFFLEEGIKNFTPPVSMNIYKQLGETKISLRLKGNQYDPLTATAEETDDEIFSARLAILNSNRDRISYNEGINSMRRLFSSALEIVVIAIPLVVFISMMSLTALSRPESLFQLVKLIIGQGFGVILALLVSIMMVWLAGKTSPINFAKKAISFFPIPFAAASSNGALPATMKFATKNLGISSKLTSFVVPVGLSLVQE